MSSSLVGVECLLSVDDLSKVCQVPTATIYKWRTTGSGPRGLRIGKHLRFRAADVESWLDEQAGGDA